MISHHIECTNLSKNFGSQQVLKNINLEIMSGEKCVIQGASGCGKSTLLYLIGGMDRPSQGQIWSCGLALHKADDDELSLYRNSKLGFVFQFHFLLPSMNCLDNILLPARIGGKNIQKVESRIHDWAQILQINHCLDKYPYQISGGEQQRINLLRALSLKPKLLLCDEPTGNLDSVNSQLVIKLLKDMSDLTGSTLIVVTHDEKVASQFERKIVIEDGQIIG